MRSKTIRISKYLLKEILDYVPDDHWEYWREHVPNVYKRLKEVIKDIK